MDARSSSDEERFFAERGFGLQMGFGERPAVLVVDLMRAFTDPSLPLGANLDRELAATNRVIDAAHEADAPVLFSIVRYDEPDCRDAGIWGLKQRGLFGLTADAPAVALDDRLHRAAGDVILLKKYASCFFGTDLVSRLQARRIDTLVLTGCTTSGCVRASTVDAIQYGFRPIVVREAVGDRSRPAHEQSLFDIQAKYGDVMSVDAAIEALLATRRTAPTSR
jgi:nicotinamidase-related amidase